MRLLILVSAYEAYFYGLFSIAFVYPLYYFLEGIEYYIVVVAEGPALYLLLKDVYGCFLFDYRVLYRSVYVLFYVFIWRSL